MSTAPRARFAPSPTGVLHVGGARTALFNYLYARSVGGVLVLRIEDTDRERSTPEAVQVILDGLAWLGLDWDEGPLFQSERTDLYRGSLEELLSSGKAYRCACTKEELQAKREAAQREKLTYRYDRTCRERDIPASVPHTVRAPFPIDGQTVIHDLLRGDLVFENAEFDDIIIARTDGSPTYNFTVVVDDSDMGITHVIRGDDHLYNTPKQHHLYGLLGRPVPSFAHIPLVNGPDGRKLSKRHGPTSILDYREMGFLPEVMVSYLARLGWSHGDREEFTLSELERLFELTRVKKTAAVFDVVKLKHFNALHIRSADPAGLARLLRPFLLARSLDPEVPWLPRAVSALQERSRTLVEMVDWLVPFYAEEIEYQEKAVKKHLKPGKAALLPSLADALSEVEAFVAADLEAAASEWLETNDLLLKTIGQTIRVALMGGPVSPPLFDTMELLGREKTLARLRAAPDVPRPAGEGEENP